MDLFSAAIMYTYVFILVLIIAGGIIAGFTKVKTNKENKIIFFDTLGKAIQNNLTITIKSIVQYYEGIYGKCSENMDNKIITLLSQYKVSIVNNTEKSNIIEIDNMVSELIFEFEKRSPFSFLPANERNNFSETLDYCDTENVDAIKNKLKDISGILNEKNNMITKLSKQKKYSIPTAIISIILTLFFGITQFFF